MKQKNTLKILLGVLCVALLLLVGIVAVTLDSRSPDPILGIFRPQPTTQPTQDDTAPFEEQLPHPESLPASVDIPSETDPETGENTSISFPCQVPGYGLVIEKLAPYSGMFVENGSNVTVENVAMLLVRNTGDFPVEYTQLRVMCGQEELLFHISALPVGAKLVDKSSCRDWPFSYGAECRFPYR